MKNAAMFRTFMTVIVSIIGLIVFLLIFRNYFHLMSSSSKSCFSESYTANFPDEKSVRLDSCPIEVKLYTVDSVKSIKMTQYDLAFQKETKLPSFVIKFDKIIADSLFECWKRTGENKPLLANKIKTIDPQSTICIVCSRLVFDQTVGKEIQKELLKKSKVVYLSDLDFGKYLQSQKTLSGTYYDLISRGNLFLSSLFFENNFLKIPVYDPKKNNENTPIQLGMLNVEFLSTSDNYKSLGEMPGTAIWNILQTGLTKLSYVASLGFDGKIPFPDSRYSFVSSQDRVIKASTLPIAYNAQGVKDFCTYVVNGCSPNDNACLRLKELDRMKISDVGVSKH